MDGRAVPTFINKALNNENIEIYGDGTQTRSLCHVDDLIDGIMKMMNTDDDIIGPVNIGNDDELTINELAAKIIKLTNSKSQIIYKELLQDDPSKRKPDLTVARNLLNYTPRISIDEGLKNTIEYFKNQRMV